MGFATRGITSTDIADAILEDGVKLYGETLNDLSSDIANAKDDTLNNLEYLRKRLYKIYPFYWNYHCWYGVIAGTWSISQNTNHARYFYLQNAGGAANDEIALGMFIVPSTKTYTLYFTTIKHSSCGRVTFYRNNTSLGETDLYSSATQDTYVGSVGFGSLTAGDRYSIRLKITSKNANASDYRIYISEVYVE